MTYVPTIGLEVHAELRTHSKMFCGCANDPNETRPNWNVCPICMGHPGTLPVINKEAVRQVLRIGMAVGGVLADLTEFDRKNYFYPDIPKGYQISQYKYPLVTGGRIREVELTRIHLEEDTARSTHENGEYSNIDFNRAGVPLMELVTAPVIHSAQEASLFAKELRLLLRTLGASNANMEKGEMRVEANISVAPARKPFGTKVEIKNLNSFRSVERAIEFEVARHISLLERGERVVQETRGWDDVKQKTFSQRLKEEAQEYRYFPDPDLPKLMRAQIPDFADHVLRESLPELPWEARLRLVGERNITPEVAEVLVQESTLKVFFDNVVQVLAGEAKTVQLAVNYLTSDILGLVEEGVVDLEVLSTRDPREFAQLMQMTARGDVSSRGAKDTLRAWIGQGGNPHMLAEQAGLLQVSDDNALLAHVDAVIAEHATVFEDYRNGKESALQFLVGQGMKHSRGAANPARLGELFRARVGR